MVVFGRHMIIVDRHRKRLRCVSLEHDQLAPGTRPASIVSFEDNTIDDPIVSAGPSPDPFSDRDHSPITSHNRHTEAKPYSPSHSSINTYEHGMRTSPGQHCHNGTTGLWSDGIARVPVAFVTSGTSLDTDR